MPFKKGWNKDKKENLVEGKLPQEGEEQALTEEEVLKKLEKELEEDVKDTTGLPETGEAAAETINKLEKELLEEGIPDDPPAGEKEDIVEPLEEGINKGIKKLEDKGFQFEGKEGNIDEIEKKLADIPEQKEPEIVKTSFCEFRNSENNRKFDKIRNRLRGLEDKIQELQSKLNDTQNPEEILKEGDKYMLKCGGCGMVYEGKFVNEDDMVNCPNCHKNNIFKNGRNRFLDKIE